MSLLWAKDIFVQVHGCTKCFLYCISNTKRRQNGIPGSSIEVFAAVTIKIYNLWWLVYELEMIHLSVNIDYE